jgi:hypothetical protein
MIIKSLPKIKPDFQLSTVNEVIGDTLFINGVPHKFCGKCGAPIHAADGIRTNVSGRKVEFKPYKISIMAGWIDEGEEIIYRNGFPEIKRHKRPIIIQRLGCFDCWNLQQKRKLNSSDKEWMYDIRECFKAEVKK